MGDRAQVKIKQTPHSIFLYTHWGAETVLADTAYGLFTGRDRWGDPTYLSRIIFDSMKRDSFHQQVSSSTSGFGIGTKQLNDIVSLVTVSPDETSMLNTVDHSKCLVQYDNFETGRIRKWTFDELIKNEGI